MSCAEEFLYNSHVHVHVYLPLKRTTLIHGVALSHNLRHSLDHAMPPRDGFAASTPGDRPHFFFWKRSPWLGQSVSQLFHGPAPRSPLHRLAVRLRHSRSNTSTEYSLPGATQLSQVRSISPSGQSPYYSRYSTVRHGTIFHRYTGGGLPYGPDSGRVCATNRPHPRGKGPTTTTTVLKYYNRCSD